MNTLRCVVALLAIALSACSPDISVEMYRVRCVSVGGEYTVPLVGPPYCKVPDALLLGDSATVRDVEVAAP